MVTIPRSKSNLVVNSEKPSVQYLPFFQKRVTEGSIGIYYIAKINFGYLRWR